MEMAARGIYSWKLECLNCVYQGFAEVSEADDKRSANVDFCIDDMPRGFCAKLPFSHSVEIPDPLRIQKKQHPVPICGKDSLRRSMSRELWAIRPPAKFLSVSDPHHVKGPRTTFQRCIHRCDSVAK
jgi:hypothetical protein